MNKHPVVEFRKFAHSPRASQETNQFTADLFINGKKVGFVEDQGHGGDAWCRWDKDTSAEQELFKEFIAALEPWRFPESFGAGTEPQEWDESYFFSSLASAHIEYNADKKRCATHFAFRTKEQPKNQMWSMKFQTKASDPRRPEELKQQIAATRKKYGDQLEVIYNERDFTKIPSVDVKFREPVTTGS